MATGTHSLVPGPGEEPEAKREHCSAPVLDGPGGRVLQAVYDIGETFTKTLRLQPVLERIIRSVLDIAHGDAGSVMLVSESGDELVVAAAIGPRADIILGTRQPVTASIAGKAIQEGGPLLIEGKLSRRGPLASRHPQDISQSMVMPIRVGGRLIGVLNVNCHADEKRLTPEILSLLQLLANQAALVIEIARLYEELARKERRLELFVDKFLRLQAEQKRSIDINESKLENMLSDLMRRTIEQYVSEVKKIEDDPHPTFDRLTARELEVLGYIVEGLTNKEIARRLKISTDTVKNHVVHIVNKLGAVDRTQAAVMAIRYGLLK